MKFKLFLAVLAIVLFPINIATAESNIETFLINLINQAQYYSKSETLSEKEKEEGLYDVFTQSFDVPNIGRFILGRHWKTASPTQRREFLSVFSAITVQTYAPMLSKITISKFTVKKIQSLNDNSIMLAHSIISRENEADIKITWRIAYHDNRYQILDVQAEGISFILALRSQYVSVIRREGGLDNLIDTLWAQVEKLQKRAEK